MRSLYIVTGLTLSLVVPWLVNAEYRIETSQKISLGSIKDGGIYRVAICPNGMTIITSSTGSAIMVTSNSTVVLNRSDVPEFVGVTATTCDAQNRLWVEGAGEIRRFGLAPTGELSPQLTLKVGGSANRIFVFGDYIYVVGLARVDGRLVILRRFSLSGGSRPDVLSVDLPVMSGKVVNQLPLNGSVFVAGGRLVYVPANPFEFWIFDLDGRLIEVKRPQMPHFANLDMNVLRQTPIARWRSVDWAFNAVPLPDGTVVVQLQKGNDLNTPPEATAPNNWLGIFDSKLELLASPVPADALGLTALLIGADSGGTLYFSDLNILEGGTLHKVRLSWP